MFILSTVLLASVAALACGDDGSEAGGPEAGPDGGTGPVIVIPPAVGPDGGTIDSRYVVSTTVFGAEGNTQTYFGIVPDMRSGKLDLGLALEAPGMAKLYSRDGNGWFALGGGEAPTVTRYDLGADDKLTQGASISFQPNGTAFLGDMMVFVSPTKAYYFDAPNQQLIRWNPEAMTVDGTIDLAVTAKTNLTTIFALKPLLRADGTLLFPVTWRNFETDDTYSGTGLVVVDTATDTLRKYTESAACQGVTWSAITSDGTLYAATTPFYAVLQRVNGKGPASCVLRIQPGADEFDATYKVDLAALVGGRVAGGLARGPEGELFFRAIGTDVAIGPTTSASDVWSDAVWRWYRWNLASGQATAVDTLPLSSAGGLTYDVDGRTYATDSAADFSSTTLLDMTAPGGPVKALEAPGYIYGLSRVR